MEFSNWFEVKKAQHEGSLHKLWGPRVVEFEVTNRCNLKCAMCNRWRWPKKATESQLTLSQIKKLFKQLKTAGVQKVLLAGGEPLMRSDFPEIIRIAMRNELGVILFTNGTLMNEETVKELAAIDAEIVFSIDGSNAALHDAIRGVQGAFDRAIAGIRLARAIVRRTKSAATIGINYTVQSVNAADIPAAYKLATVLGVDCIRFGIVHGTTQTACGLVERRKIRAGLAQLRELNKNGPKRYASIYLKAFADGNLKVSNMSKGLPALQFFMYKPRQCFLCQQYALIDAFGDVYPCTYSYYDNHSFNERLYERVNNRLGNILKKPFDAIWNGSRYNVFRKSHNPVNILREKNVCGQCEHYFAFEKIEQAIELAEKAEEMLAKISYDDYSYCGSNVFETGI